MRTDVISLVLTLVSITGAFACPDIDAPPDRPGERMSAIYRAYPGISAQTPASFGEKMQWAYKHPNDKEACRIFAATSLYALGLAVAVQTKTPETTNPVTSTARPLAPIPPFPTAGIDHSTWPALDKESAERLVQVQGLGEIRHQGLLMTGWPDPYASINLRKTTAVGSTVRILSVYHNNMVRVAIISVPPYAPANVADVNDQGVLLFSEVAIVPGQNLPPEKPKPPVYESDRPLVAASTPASTFNSTTYQPPSYQPPQTETNPFPVILFAIVGVGVIVFMFMRLGKSTGTAAAGYGGHTKDVFELRAENLNVLNDPEKMADMEDVLVVDDDGCVIGTTSAIGKAQKWTSEQNTALPHYNMAGAATSIKPLSLS